MLREESIFPPTIVGSPPWEENNWHFRMFGIYQYTYYSWSNGLRHGAINKKSPSPSFLARRDPPRDPSPGTAWFWFSVFHACTSEKSYPPCITHRFYLLLRLRRRFSLVSICFDFPYNRVGRLFFIYRWKTIKAKFGRGCFWGKFFFLNYKQFIFTWKTFSSKRITHFRLKWWRFYFALAAAAVCQKFFHTPASARNTAG